MPQKRKKRPPPPIEDPPTASSSESEEGDDRPRSSQPHAAAAAPPPVAAAQVSSSEDEDDSSKEDKKQRSTLPASANPPSNAHPKSSFSESDTDSEPTRAKSKSKPKPKSKPTDQLQPQDQAQRSSAQVKHVSKRSIHKTDPKHLKKKRADAPSSSVANDATEEDGNKSGSQAKLFQRIWSPEDEVGILKGILEFISMTGQDPYRYADAFHSFIKKSLHVEFSSFQLKEKIRRMKKRCKTHLERQAEGKEPRLLKPHDQTLFEFSKKIWIDWPNGLVEKPKFNGKGRKPKKKESATTSVPKAKDNVLPQPSAPLLALPAPGEYDSGDVSLLYRKISCFEELDADEMKRGLTLIGESKRKELERRWNMLVHSEMELLANRSLLIGEQIKLISEALQSSSN